jgi:hypothetical protein
LFSHALTTGPAADVRRTGRYDRASMPDTEKLAAITAKYGVTIET